jgi:hypothetical protein
MLAVTQRSGFMGRRRAAVGAVTTWNPADKNAEITLSGGNLIATRTGGAGSTYTNVRATVAHSAGKKYFQCKAIVSGASSELGSLALADASFELGWYFGASGVGGISFAHYLNGSWYESVGGGSGSGVSISTGEWGRCAVDFNAGNIWFGNETAWIGDPAAGTDPVITFTPPLTLFAGVTLYAVDDQVEANFGAAAFNDAPPSGFSAWNS